ncbi:tRNA (adenosine(37)-N6)-threonylcarbamoyltransferase complex transferase subunit TsaD, partial [Candidatus Uhrbacteria bacterium]|nr:tRNA (adenosine(37)-N6)-threonylcarbamoyltransferase complex transferase subunit TsaD [Candidatus Uhrbacteria bacterium]
EAFDKTAAQLGLPYPGGPAVSKAGDTGSARFVLPRPMINDASLDMSFSGLKTAVRYLIEETPSEKRDAAFVADVCRAFEEAVVDVLVSKAARAVDELTTRGATPATVLLCGGVAANTRLRERMAQTFSQMPAFVVPEIQFATDNAVMIAAAGALRLERNDVAADPYIVDADPNHVLGTPWEA